MQLITIKDGRKAILRLGGTGKDHGVILLMSITTKTYPAVVRTCYHRGQKIAKLKLIQNEFIFAN